MSNVQDNAAHTCSYSCDRPQCIKAQRDELAAAAAQEAVGAVVENVNGEVVSYRGVLFAKFILSDNFAPGMKLYAAPVTAAPTGFDRARETPRRQRAVELLLSMGYQWRDSEWIAPGTPAAPGIDRADLIEIIEWWNAYTGPVSDAIGEIVRRIRALADASPKGDEPRTPIDGCTESNCPRCRTHPDHRGDMEHAGIGRRPPQDSPKGGSEAEVMQLRYQLNSLRQLLSGFDIAVQKNPLQPPCTYLEEVRLSHEFQPGCGHEVAAALRNALKLESEGAKQ